MKKKKKVFLKIYICKYIGTVLLKYYLHITYIFVSRLQNVNSQAQTGYGYINQPDLECLFMSELLSLFLELSLT